MVSIIKLKELGFDLDHLNIDEDHNHEHVVHHMLKGYKKFNKDYIELLSNHSESVFGITDIESFKQELINKSNSEGKDDALHCALSIMSIHHRKRSHVKKGHGLTYPEAHRIVINFIKQSPERVTELKNRFPHINDDVLAHFAENDQELEQLLA